MSKVNTRENIRGNWLTRLEIDQIRNSIARDIENELIHNENIEIVENGADNVNNINQPDPIVPPRNEALPEQDQENLDEIMMLKEMIFDSYVENLATPLKKTFKLKKNRGAKQ